MFCPRCGAQNADTAKFCQHCGNALGSSKNSKKKNTKTVYYIIGAIIIVIALIVAIMLGMRSKKAKEYDTYLASAEKYIEELDYEQAEDFYLKAINVAPKKLKPYVQLAEVYISSGEVEKAKVIIEKAEAQKAKGDEETESKLEEIIVLLEEAKDMVNYQWVVEPTIEADDIYYVAEFDPYGSYHGEMPLNNDYRQTYSEYAVINRGNSLGLIKQNGKIIGDLEYKEVINYGDDSYMLIRKEPLWEPEFEAEMDSYWLIEDRLLPDFGIGDYAPAAFYYCDGLHEIYNYRKEIYSDASSPRVPIPVKQSESVFKGYDGFKFWGALSGKYGIYYDGEMRTDFIYDECGSYSDGLLAVCQDGKWGYVDQNGEVIIPLEYDASWTKFDPEWDYLLEKEEARDYCYAASDGYVVLCKDGEWELRDTEGKLAIPSGTFEEILPVYEGKCWVKQAGKWGVIEL